ncbi:MAG: epoxyqueuosine reductase QueH [Elusimicrobia bacterium]|nr:epoxyqueuosine reductase QueH [Elusimicrobiota bacterium]
MERLLLHHCCAPCSPSVLDMLSKDFEIKSFWFNPNIQPKDEHDKRKEALIVFLTEQGKELINGPDFSKDSWIWQNTRKNTERCKLCYYLRLSQTALEAKRLNIRNFSSTLLSSPHQKHEDIKFIAEQIAKAENLNFIYRDFRPFYYDGKNKIAEKKLYVQKYCGCSFSLEEQKEKKQK